MVNQPIEPHVKPLDVRAREAINMLRGTVQTAGYQTTAFAVASALV